MLTVSKEAPQMAASQSEPRTGTFDIARALL
jgi:hypothetical protein